MHLIDSKVVKNDGEFSKVVSVVKVNRYLPAGGKTDRDGVEMKRNDTS